MKLASYFPLNEASQALDTEASLRHVLESVKLKTHPSFDLFGAIDHLNTLKRHRQAYELILYFDDLFPSDSAISFCLAYQNYLNGCFIQGDLILKDLASQPDLLPLFELEAEGSFRRADFDRCDALFQKAAISRMPMGSYIYWIQALLMLKRFHDALTIATQAVGLFPKERDLQALLMECLIETDQPESAYQLLSKADCSTPPLSFDLAIKLVSQLAENFCDSSCINLLNLIDGWVDSVSPALSSFDQNSLMHVRKSLLDSSSGSSSDVGRSVVFAETTDLLAIDAQGMDFISAFMLCCELQLSSHLRSVSLLVISDYNLILADLFDGIAFTTSLEIAECLTSESNLYKGLDCLSALSIDGEFLIYAQDVFLRFLGLSQSDDSASNVVTGKSLNVCLCSSTDFPDSCRQSVVEQVKQLQLIPDLSKVAFVDYESQFDVFSAYGAGIKPVQAKYAFFNDLQVLSSSEFIVTASENMALLACFLNKKICLANHDLRSRHFMLNWFRALSRSPIVVL